MPDQFAALRVFALDGVTPVVDPRAFVHPSAVLIGDVIVGPGCYVGPNACLRGDFGRVVLGQGVNVQDTCVLHSFPGEEVVVEQNGHVGHGAVLHGCRIGKNVLVGMNAVIMDGASIGESAIIAACSFVKAGYTSPARVLLAGVPAKVLRELSDDEISRKGLATRAYQELSIRCLSGLEMVAPLQAEEVGRKRIEMTKVPPLTDRK
ncbi:MAG: transferase hexapeptide repeat family protein [Desulfobulbaceae bacterium]|nr:transferase hexapeptide repeat family protein [Desulfobulbaceae bacterium]